MSLLEMLLVWVILGILLALSSMGLRFLLQHNEQQVLVLRLTNAIRYAQDLAITRQQSVILCGGIRSRCDGQWSLGLQVVLAKTGQVVRQFNMLAKDVHVIWRGSLGKTALLFSANGMSATRGSFVICAKSRQNGQNTRLIVVRSEQVRSLNERTCI